MTTIAVNTPEHIEHRLQTTDGRVLAVAEWGDRAGLPLIELHGTPGGRISYRIDPSIDARYGLRRITFDRPGYGESTRLSGRAVADVVPDVAAIADALGINRFVVMGGSGGGPHALACAALLPRRVTRCLIAVSPAPVDAEGLAWLDGQTEGNVAEFTAARDGEAAIRSITERERATTLARLAAGHGNIFSDSYELSSVDRQVLAKHRAQAADMMSQALARGVDGWVDDDIAFTRPWGFDIGRIRGDLYITYGRLDTLVPAAHGDWLAAHLPQAKVVVREDAGHLADDAEVEAQYAWLAGRAERPPS